MITPLHDLVVVVREEPAAQTVGGIFIPTTAQEKTQQAIVKAVGPGTLTINGTLVPLSLKEGDRVIIEKHAGHEIKMDGENYVLVREENILAKI